MFVSDATTGDPELKAMGAVLEALAHLEPSVQARVLQWVATKLQIEFQPAPRSTGRLQSDSEISRPAKPSKEGTVSSVAIKLGADSCRTLLITAAAHITLYQGKDTFTRAEWINCAKDARPWKADYNSQIPTIIGRLLTSGFIFEKSKDVFSVSEKDLAELEQRLAD